jgi:uncharacterized protein YjbI with pentapeptide repeats
MKTTIRFHRIWLSSPSEGPQADPRRAPEARYYDVDLSGTEVGEAQFYRARLHHSRLRELKARGANFTGARIDHCDLSGAELAGSNFFRAEITQSIFRGADLEGCDFREVRLRGCDFRGAYLRGAIGLTPEQIAQAIIDAATTLP